MYHNTDSRTTEEIVAAEAPFWTYNRTDRNGTRYFTSCKCERCNGKGVINYYHYVDAGVCFECGGSGRSKLREIKVYTAEHAEKLEAAAEARHQKKEAERVAKLKASRGERLEKYGFGHEDGAYVIYRVVGNTFPIKDELKALGCKFNASVGWYASRALTDHECQRMTSAEVLDEECLEIVWKDKDDIKKLFVENSRPIDSPSTWVGEVGERIELTLHVDRVFVSSYRRNGGWYGTSVSYMYLMHDEHDNVYKWSTSCYYEEGEQFKCRATIKDHTEYNGIKQTVLTRCTKLK